LTHTDWSAWPVVEVHISPAYDEQDGAASFDALEQSLAREQPFAVLFVLPPDAGPRRGRHAPERMRRLKAARPRMAALCRGIAYVAPPEELEREARVLVAGPQIFGCATEGFATIDQARAWARGRLAGELASPAS
jgi:hypothetical protein